MSTETTPITTQAKTSSGWFFGRLVNFIERQRPSDRVFLRGLFFITIISLLVSLVLLSQRFSEPTPVTGGTLVEGIVGVPRFVNPVLAVTRADQDMVALIFGGLMKIAPDGTLVPDIAESITTSSDGTIYNVVIRPDIRFHDGTPLTARDVTFTIGLMQDSDLKSPLRGNWVGVAIEEISEYELNIILTEAYTPFIENLTFGILPRHIWSEIPIEQIPSSRRNTEPIGSGPFRIKEITKNSSDDLVQAYHLERFPEYHHDIMLNGVRVRFYQNENTLMEGLTKGEFVSTVYAPLSSLSALEGQDRYRIITSPLPRVFAVFLNQNRSVSLRDQAARQALAESVNRTELVSTVLNGYGVPTIYPIPPHHPALQSDSSVATTTNDAAAILTAGGWRQNSDGQWEKRIGGDMQTLTVTLRTTNNPTFNQTAESLRRTWESLGVNVFVEQYEQSDLLQSVIRPRDFEALLFGIDMNRAVDLYPFWHSSQREDPGLNIAQYANIAVDSQLEKARATRDETERQEALATSLSEINDDSPAVFLFVPSLTYLVRSDIETANITGLSRPHERFMNINEWHMANEERWSLFR